MPKQVVIERNPQVDDNIVLLDRHETIAGYAKTYGDRLTEWYEDHKLIVLPFWPIEADHEYLQTLSLPSQLSKIGSANSIHKPLFERFGTKLISRNALSHLKIELPLKVYLRDQIASIFSQLWESLPLLFPRYQMQEMNTTFRYTPTASEGSLHLDVFQVTGDDHRLKLFINMDIDDRVWRTSYNLPRVMELYKEHFTDIGPDVDRNTLNRLINERVGSILPRHVVRYPTFSCVIGNGETLMHEVVSGNRMIALEYRVEVNSMMNPEKYIGTMLPQHLRNLGYTAQESIPAV